MNVKGGFKTNQKVEVIDGVPVPEEIHIEATDPSWPFAVSMIVKLYRGRMKVRSISYAVHEGKEIESADLRIPVLRILRAGVASALGGLSSLAGQNLDEVREQGPTEESLRVVAAAYRLAYVAGHSPTQAVAELLDIPHPTAARWVQKAREAKILGPAEERRAGEQKKQSKNSRRR